MSEEGQAPDQGDSLLNVILMANMLNQAMKNNKPMNIDFTQDQEPQPFDQPMEEINKSNNLEKMYGKWKYKGEVIKDINKPQLIKLQEQQNMNKMIKQFNNIQRPKRIRYSDNINTYNLQKAQNKINASIDQTKTKIKEQKQEFKDLKKQFKSLNKQNFNEVEDPDYLSTQDIERAKKNIKLQKTNLSKMIEQQKKAKEFKEYLLEDEKKKDKKKKQNQEYDYGGFYAGDVWGDNPFDNGYSVVYEK